MVEKVSLSVFSDDERAEYDRLEAALSDARKPITNVFHPAAVPAYLATLAWLVAVALTGLWLLSMDATPDPSTFGIRGLAGGTVLAVFVVTLLGGMVPILIVLGRGISRWQEAQESDGEARIAAFLGRIGYEERLRDSRAGGSSQWTSIRQSQHAWYGSHSELNWRDRERAEASGMDADTYINNVLEHDKD